eukprot:TRINITY_DN191_c0_g1_i2.p1 TRINITY_DN191_c0_g1~~TRINITY_DN191_c0_g1_i2.p1  ORF type:complete len:392 (+),score=113.38 TRINITY_DN191_c0_g1_i2:57-1232(+)
MLCMSMLLVFVSSLALSSSQDLAEPSCAAPALLQASAQRALMEASNSSKNASKVGHNKSEQKDIKKHSDTVKKEGQEDIKKHSHERKTMPTYSEVDKNKDGVLTPKEFQKTQQQVDNESAEKKDKGNEKTNAADSSDDQSATQGSESKSHKPSHDKKKERVGGKGHGVAESSDNVVPAPKMPSYSDVDMNNDGVLTPSEFEKRRANVIAEIEKRVRKVIKNESKLEDLKLGLERKIDEMPAYEDLDTNRDGVLTPAEYTTAGDTAMAKNLSYKKLDLDNDGAVTPEEFKDASEMWAAEMTKLVQEKVEEIRKARDERRQLEQEIDRMQSYSDLDDKRDGVVTPAEYVKEVRASHGAWSVNSNTSAREAKAGASATGLGSLAGLAALVLSAL